MKIDSPMVNGIPIRHPRGQEPVLYATAKQVHILAALYSDKRIPYSYDQLLDLPRAEAQARIDSFKK